MLSIRLNGWQQTILVSNGLEWNGSYIEWNLSESTALNKTKLTCTCIWHGLPYENGLHHHNFAKCRRILHEISAAKFLIMHWGQGQQQQWYTALSTMIYSLIKARYNSAPKSTHRVSHRQNFIKKNWVWFHRNPPQLWWHHNAMHTYDKKVSGFFYDKRGMPSLQISQSWS